MLAFADTDCTCVHCQAATTPLISASGEGNERMVQLLVDNDADLNLADEVSTNRQRSVINYLHFGGK